MGVLNWKLKNNKKKYKFLNNIKYNVYDHYSLKETLQKHKKYAKKCLTFNWYRL